MKWLILPANVSKIDIKDYSAIAPKIADEQAVLKTLLFQKGKKL